MNTTKIVLTPEEHTELSRRVRSATISQRDGRRARVILLASQSYTRAEIARLTGLSLAVITGWCQRFQAQRLDGLVDKPGRGRKPSLPLEARIGEPRWSCRSMARAAGISATSMHKIWAANDLKPHLTRSFKLSKKSEFRGKILGCHRTLSRPAREGFGALLRGKESSTSPRTYPAWPPPRDRSYSHAIAR